jgi:hypothetical protein
LKADKITAVHRWFQSDPHLDESGELVNRESLLGICLGLGILLDDACLIEFTEGDYGKDVPRYIVDSKWDPSDCDKLVEYSERLREALWNKDGKLR